MDEFERAAELIEPDNADSLAELCEIYTGNSMRKVQPPRQGQPDSKRQRTTRAASKKGGRSPKAQ